MPLKLRKSLPSKEKLYTAHVRLLDNTVIDINLAVTAKGKDCLDKIAQKLGLHEVSETSFRHMKQGPYLEIFKR